MKGCHLLLETRRDERKVATVSNKRGRTGACDLLHDPGFPLQIQVAEATFRDQVSLKIPAKSPAWLSMPPLYSRSRRANGSKSFSCSWDGKDCLPLHKTSPSHIQVCIGVVVVRWYAYNSSHGKSPCAARPSSLSEQTIMKWKNSIHSALPLFMLSCQTSFRL